MKKTKAIVSIVSLSLLLFACVIPGVDEVKDAITDKITEGAMNTAQDILSAEKPQTCTWKDADDNEATMYSDGKEKYRYESDTAEGVSYMISDADYVYMWLKGSDEGTKWAVVEPEEVESSDDTVSISNDTSYDASEDEAFLEEEFEISCENWKVDSSKFKPPSSVEFTDMEQMLKDLEQQMLDLEDSLGDFDL